MNNIINQMLSNYKIDNVNDETNALKEIMQEIVLYGLSQANFFQHAAFYGGTALRIFYGLDRFSEDLDFSLKTTNLNFDLNDFIPTLKKTLDAYGLNVDVSVKEKVNDSQIKSAFLKGNTVEHLLLFYPDRDIKGINPGAKIKVKFEVDIDPPSSAKYQTEYRLLPAPYNVTLYDETSLFAGKIHAVIFRSWKNRVKGRDLYDYIFYLSRNISVNLEHLEARMRQSGHWDLDKNLTIEDVRKQLVERFEEIDYEDAKKDVLPFIKDDTKLDIWSKDFFIGITKQLKAD